MPRLPRNDRRLISGGDCTTEDAAMPLSKPIPVSAALAPRLPQPQVEILDGTWKFPEAQPVS